MALGYTGTLCSNCAYGYARSTQHNCKKCVAITVVMVLLGLCFFLGCIAYLVQRVEKNIRKSYEKDKRREVELFKIFLNGLYGFGAVSVLPLKYPSTMDSLFAAGRQLTSIASESLSLECFLNSQEVSKAFLSNMIFQLVPLLSVLFAALYWYVVYLGKVGKASMHEEQLKKIVWNRFAVTCVIIFFMLVAGLNRSSFQMIRCEKVDVRWRAALDLDLPCFGSEGSGEHTAWVLALAIPSIILYTFFVPCSGVYVMFRLKRKRKLFIKADSASSNSVFIFLFSGFRRKSYTWEYVILLRKMILNMVLLFPDTLTSALLYLGTYNVFSALHFIMLPYKDGLLNSVEGGVLVSTSLVLYAGMFVFGDSKNEGITLFLGVFILILTVVFLLIFVHSLIHARKRRCKKLQKLLNQFEISKRIRSGSEPGFALQVVDGSMGRRDVSSPNNGQRNSSDELMEQVFGDDTNVVPSVSHTNPFRKSLDESRYGPLIIKK